MNSATSITGTKQGYLRLAAVACVLLAWVGNSHGQQIGGPEHPLAGGILVAPDTLNITGSVFITVDTPMESVAAGATLVVSDGELAGADPIGWDSGVLRISGGEVTPAGGTLTAGTGGQWTPQHAGDLFIVFEDVSELTPAIPAEVAGFAMVPGAPGATAATTPAPEPGTISLLILGGGASLLRRRRKA